jgi:hypothetical protein
MVRPASLGPDDVHAALVRERLSVANLRVQIRIAEQVLEGLIDFARRWDRFVLVLRATLDACEKGRLSIWGPKLADGLESADDARLDLASRQPALFPDCRDPLAKFLRTGVRTFSPALWELIGETYVDEDGNDVLVPVDDDGNEIYEVNVRRFEINALEAKAEIARHRHEVEAQIRKQRTMLEEAERAVANEHARQMEKLRATSLTGLALAKLRGSWLGKVVWWFVEEPLRNLLWAGVLALVAIQPAREAVFALLRWLGSLFR